MTSPDKRRRRVFLRYRIEGGGGGDVSRLGSGSSHCIDFRGRLTLVIFFFLFSGLSFTQLSLSHPFEKRKEKGISVYKRNAIRSLSVRCHDSVTLSSDLAPWISCTTTNVLSVLSIHVDPFHVPTASSRDNRQLVRCDCPASFQQHAALLCTQ